MWLILFVVVTASQSNLLLQLAVRACVRACVRAPAYTALHCTAARLAIPLLPASLPANSLCSLPAVLRLHGNQVYGLLNTEELVVMRRRNETPASARASAWVVVRLLVTAAAAATATCSYYRGRQTPLSPSPTLPLITERRTLARLLDCDDLVERWSRDARMGGANYANHSH